MGTCLGELYIFGFFHEKIISPIPLRDFAFSGSQKLKSPLASQGRRLEAGVAKDLGGVYPEARNVALTVRYIHVYTVQVVTPRSPVRGHSPGGRPELNCIP